MQKWVGSWGEGPNLGLRGGGSRKWLEGYTNIAHIDQFWTNFLGRGGGENGFRAIQF